MWFLQWIDPTENVVMHADVADSLTAGRICFTLARTYDVPVHVWTDAYAFGYDALPNGELLVTS